jgi:thiosulfate/3-mercaptopyruvate sulfurtransferase
MEYKKPELLAEPEWLLNNLTDTSSTVRVIDCAPLEAYRRAHIPGAIHLPVHNYIKEQGEREGGAGMYVMPPEDFATLMSELGISNSTEVVCYDDNNGLVATRLWWVLNYYGHKKVRVLNGGWHRWLTEGHELSFHRTHTDPQEFSVSVNPSRIAQIEDLLPAEGRQQCTVIDVRSNGEWEGSNSRGNLRTGHIPDALHLEWTDMIEQDDKRKFLKADNMLKLLEKAGFNKGKPVVTYCQGGIRAAHMAFVLELLGYSDIRVYDGSMYEWANRDDTPLV